MADITGPISTLPGSRHNVPEGMMCDEHDDRPATHRVQAETDSFGSEMWDLCDECFNKMQEEIKKEREEEKLCDWCKQISKDVRPTRDYDEGMAGPIYDVCPKCRRKQTQDAIEELEEYRNRY